MIHLLDAAAILTKPWPQVKSEAKMRVVEPMLEKRTLSPAARYAIAAVTLLQPEPVPQNMVCLCGPTGMMADAFMPAVKHAPDGQFNAPGFPKRSRRIHPLNLIRNLQNQVPSALSQSFGIHGKVLNALESATSLAYLLPNMMAMVQGGEALLLVVASAANRREEKAKRLCYQKGTTGIEGAFAFLLATNGGRGTLSACVSSLATRDIPWEPVFGDPLLDAGGLLMACFQQNPQECILPLRDAWGHRSALRWKGR